MTDSEDKGGAADKGGPSDKDGSQDKGGTPSTLEKALARASDSRKTQAGDPEETEAQTLESQDSQEAKDGDAAIVENDGEDKDGDKPRRSVGGYLVAALSILLLLAVAYISWPAWGPSAPGWLQTALAPVMGMGRGADTGKLVAQLTTKIEPLERQIAGLKAEFAARPVVDPARLLALDDLVRQHGEWLAKLKTDVETLGRKADSGGSADEIAILTKRLEDMETQLVTLAARPSEASDPGAAAAAVSALDALRSQSSERMSALERENVALRDIVAALDRRVGSIEQKPAAVPGGTTRGNALVIAVGQLREAGRGTEPFGVALQAVEALAESEEALVKPIAVLKPFAQTGVPDLIALRAHFNRIAGRIAHEAFVPKGEGWVDRTLGKLSRIFTFRRTGTAAAAGDDENARVAQAELRLAAGDLATAVTVLEGLKEPALGYARPWLKDARARLAVDGAIRTLFSEALARTRASADGKGAPGG